MRATLGSGYTTALAAYELRACIFNVVEAMPSLHGVARVARYVNDMRRGAINVKANIRVERETAGTLVVHGDWGFGQVVTAFTFDRLMERARTQGIAAAGIHHCNDTARLGAYTHAAAQAGFFALMMVNDGGWEPMIAPWGGRKALFSRNPISAAAPGPDGPAFCVDFSTSVTAVSAVRLALSLIHI